MTKSSSTLVTMMTFINRAEAELAKDRLEQGGIRAYVRSDDAGGMIPQLTAISEVELQVEERYLEEAREILGLGKLRRK